MLIMVYVLLRISWMHIVFGIVHMIGPKAICETDWNISKQIMINIQPEQKYKI